MPIKKYSREHIIKLLRLVEIETGQGKATVQACRELEFVRYKTLPDRLSDHLAIVATLRVKL